jgi:putative ABC transport system permease protein
LGLGIGASSVIFGAVHAVLLRPLPFRTPDRLVEVFSLDAHGQRWMVAPVNFAAILAQGVFEEAAAIVAEGDASAFNLSAGPVSERVEGCIVTDNFFQLLGMQAALGRPLVPGDEQALVAVVSDSFWRRVLGGDPRQVGRAAIRLNGRLYTVVGVLPRGFTFPGRSQLWVPGALNPQPVFNDGVPYYPSVQIIGRLRPGVSAVAADRALRSLAGSLLNPYTAARGTTPIRPGVRCTSSWSNAWPVGPKCRRPGWRTSSPWEGALRSRSIRPRARRRRRRGKSPS